MLFVLCNQTSVSGCGACPAVPAVSDHQSSHDRLNDRIPMPLVRFTAREIHFILFISVYRSHWQPGNVFIRHRGALCGSFHTAQQRLVMLSKL